VTNESTSKEGPLRHLAQDLAELERVGLLRVRPEPVDQAVDPRTVYLGSNDYLGYRSTGRLARTRGRRDGASGGSGRLAVRGEFIARIAPSRRSADGSGSMKR
jgi:hypothetical protein